MIIVGATTMLGDEGVVPPPPDSAQISMVAAAPLSPIGGYQRGAIGYGSISPDSSINGNQIWACQSITRVDFPGEILWQVSLIQSGVGAVLPQAHFGTFQIEGVFDGGQNTLNFTTGVVDVFTQDTYDPVNDWYYTTWIWTTNAAVDFAVDGNTYALDFDWS